MTVFWNTRAENVMRHLRLTGPSKKWSFKPICPRSISVEPWHKVFVKPVKSNSGINAGVGE